MKISGNLRSLTSIVFKFLKQKKNQLQKKNKLSNIFSKRKKLFKEKTLKYCELLNLTQRKTDFSIKKSKIESIFFGYDNNITNT